jgi:hypothetical protein
VPGNSAANTFRFTTAGRPRFGRVNAVLTAKGLSAGHADRVIFSGVDLVAPPEKVIGLVGANGAGKPVTGLRRLLPLGRGPWIGRRLVLPVLRLPQLFDWQIPDKDDGGVL